MSFAYAHNNPKYKTAAKVLKKNHICKEKREKATLRDGCKSTKKKSYMQGKKRKSDFAGRFFLYNVYHLELLFSKNANRK